MTVISEANEEEQRGASYIRWGRKVCEGNATLVYKGDEYYCDYYSYHRRLYRFINVGYCIITTCSVECYWNCSDGTVHYKSHKTVNFCGFRCATNY